MSYKVAFPQSLQDADEPLKTLVSALDDEQTEIEKRLSVDAHFDIAFMPDADVDKWLAAFGWTYKWVDPEDKRLLLKLLITIYKLGGTNQGIVQIAQSFGGAVDAPKLLEPIIYCEPLSEKNGLSTLHDTFCDDWYYNPLTVDIELPLGVKKNLKEILAIMKAVWVRYRYTFQLRDSGAHATAAQATGPNIDKILGPETEKRKIVLSGGDAREALSGSPRYWAMDFAIFYPSAGAGYVREAWMSPVVGFGADNIGFSDAVLTEGAASLTTSA